MVHLILFFRSADARTLAVVEAPGVKDSALFLLASYVQLLISSEQVSRVRSLSLSACMHVRERGVRQALADGPTARRSRVDGVQDELVAAYCPALPPNQQVEAYARLLSGA
jgi:hypothetical protein